MSSRRKFIKDAALLGGGLVLSSSLFSHCCISPVKNKKVIIIGAGFAGLMAAYELYQHNIDFEILEASSERIGGRVYSYTFGDPCTNPLVIELGAEWIGADHHLMRSLCDKLKLHVDNNQFKTHAIYRGEYHQSVEDILSKDWQLKYQTLLAEYKSLPDAEKEKWDRKLDKTDWWRYLVDHGCSDTDLDLQDLIDSTDFGECIREVSALGALDEYSKNSPESRNQMDFKITGGNKLFAEKLSAAFAGKIRLNSRVVKVVQRGKVKVYCGDGYETEGHKVICTIPTFAATRIKWDPVLPEPMLSAMESLEYARINKNAVLFCNRFWQADDFDIITDMPGHYFYHATKNQPSPSGHGVLISYTIGDKAAVVANQPDQWRAEMVSDSLYRAFGDTMPYIERQQMKYWGKDDYSHGAYAVYGKGQWFDLFDKLNKPHLHTHFAGEHLSETWGGFMEGALLTGQAAAKAVI